MSRGTPKEAVTESETAWMDDANCLGCDPVLFFPVRGEDVRDAKKVCAGCTVRGECLAYALEQGEAYGCWGGLSNKERRRVRRWWRPGMPLPPINLSAGGIGRPCKAVAS